MLGKRPCVLDSLILSFDIVELIISTLKKYYIRGRTIFGKLTRNFGITLVHLKDHRSISLSVQIR